MHVTQPLTTVPPQCAGRPEALSAEMGRWALLIHLRGPPGQDHLQDGGWEVAPVTHTGLIGQRLSSKPQDSAPKIKSWILSCCGGSNGKASAYNAGDPGSTPGLARSSGEGNGNPLQYSCMENPIDGGAW